MSCIHKIGYELLENIFVPNSYHIVTKLNPNFEY